MLQGYKGETHDVNHCNEPFKAYLSLSIGATHLPENTLLHFGLTYLLMDLTNHLQTKAMKTATYRR